MDSIPNVIDLDSASDEDLYSTWDELNTRAERATMPAARVKLVEHQNRVADELERRRAVSRAASIVPKPLPPRRPKVPKVAAMAGRGASVFLTN